MASIALNSQVLSLDAAKPDSREHRFQQLVSVYMNDLYRYAYWLTSDKHVAEDLVQETMLRAWRALDKLQKPAAAKGWLITILRRENARRFERQQLKQSAMPTEEIGDPHKYYDTSTDAFVLRQAIADLAEEYREPLLLQVIHGYSQKEIAAQLGISVAGAGTRLFRARKKLRAVLEASEAE
ncbi:MAG: sigma-70 family RNA polymerase sigma factor [bacterium]